MKKIILIFIIHCSLFIPSTQECFSQWITWQRAFYYDSNLASLKGIQTFDGGYMILNDCEANNPYNCSFGLLKLDVQGNKIWERYYNNGVYTDIIQDTDSGYVLSGSATLPQPGASILKVDKAGNPLWLKSYGISGDPHFFSIKKYFDGGFVACGYFADKAYVVRVDSGGSLIWEKLIDSSSAGYILTGLDLVINENNNVIVSGQAVYNFSLFDVCFYKMTSGGEVFLSRIYYTVVQDGAQRIIKFQNSYYMAATGGNFLYKVDTLGNMIFQKYYTPGTGLLSNTSDGNFILAGNPGLRVAARKVDTSGNEIWFKYLQGIPYYIGCKDIRLCNDGGFLLTTFAFIDTVYDVVVPYIIKTDSSFFANPIGIINEGNAIPTRLKLHQNYPNPFNPKTTIRFDIPPSTSEARSYGVRGMNVHIKIYDITGREVYSINEYKQAGSYSVTFDGTNFASGLYLYRIETGNYIETKKMVLIK